MFFNRNLRNGNITWWDTDISYCFIYVLLASVLISDVFGSSFWSIFYTRPQMTKNIFRIDRLIYITVEWFVFWHSWWSGGSIFRSKRSCLWEKNGNPCLTVFHFPCFTLDWLRGLSSNMMMKWEQTKNFILILLMGNFYLPTYFSRVRKMTRHVWHLSL